MSSENDTGRPESVGSSPFPADGYVGAVEGILDRALAVVEFLRSRCPWDRSRTPETLVPHLLEESHEVADAIRDDDTEALEGELGDLLLNVAFQIVLAEEENAFDRGSVVRRMERKMVRRHPHLFGLGEQEDWERLKAKERADSERVLSGLARGAERSPR
jgi:NTP pyrophosphatase (non-canonical NTP hydrolase)